MSLRRSLNIFTAGAIAASASWALAACSGSQTSNMAPVARPPERVQLALPPVQVARPAWTVTAAPAAPLTPPTDRRGRRMAAPSMSPEIAQTVLSLSNEPVRACYKGLLALTPQAGGSITTLMRVGADGTVSDVEPIGNTDPSLLLIMPCVLNSVRARRFPPTRSSSLISFPFVLRSGEVGTAQANAPVEVSRPRPGEIQVPNPEPVTVRPWRPTLVPNTNPVRALTRDMARETVPDITSLVDTCFSAALAMGTEVSGRFDLHIEVEPSGNVSRVELQDQSALVAPLRQCIVGLGRGLRFHSSMTGAAVSVVVTLAGSDGAAPSAPAASPAGPATALGATAPAAMIGTPTGGAATAQTGLMPMTGTPR